jgi:MarR family 2-MHQ and catechol resistance regulon transcriptional repressor
MKYTGDKDTQRALGAYANLVHAAESVNVLLGRQLDSFGLTMGQFRVLEGLLHAGPMSQVALSERLLCGHSNIVFLIGNLEKRGLVVRRAHERDKRSRMVHLTPGGQKLIARVFPLHADLIRAQMSALMNREQETLRRLCEKLGRGDPVRFALTLMRMDADEGEDG